MPSIYSRVTSAAGTILSSVALINLLSHSLSIGLSGFVMETISAYRSLVDPIFDNTIGKIAIHFGFIFPTVLKDILVIYSVIVGIFSRWAFQVSVDSLHFTLFIVIFWPIWIVGYWWDWIQNKIVLDSDDQRILKMLMTEVIWVSTIVVAALLINQTDMLKIQK